MKLKILGTAPGMSLLGYSHTSYLFEDSEKKFLIDCGEGTTQKILENNLSKDELDFIIISHLHPDHVCGLFTLLQTLYLNKRTKELLLFLPEGVEEFERFMKTLYIFEERLNYKIKVLRYVEDSFAEAGIYPFRNKHLRGYKSIIDTGNLANKMLSYSFVLRGKKKNLLLSSDIKSTEVIGKKIAECELLVLDGTHPTYEAVEELLKECKIEVYITHGDYAILQEKFAKLLSDKIKLAKQNDEVIF